MRSTREPYSSYLLRIWRSGESQSARWHVSLEDTRTGARRGFADLADAFAFLEALFSRDGPAPDAGRPGDAQPADP